MVAKAVLFAPGNRHEAHALTPPSQRLAMLPVGNRPLLAHALEEIATAGVEDVCVISEPDVADDVDRVLGSWDGSARPSRHITIGSDYGFIDALHEAAPHIDGAPFLLHLGDNLRHGGLDTAIADTPGGEHDVLALVETPSRDVTPLAAGLASLQSAGIYVFGPGVLDLAAAEDCTGAWDAQIAAAMERLETAGGHVEVRPVQGWWRFRQRPDILLQANRYYLSGIKAGPTEAWLENTDLQGPVVIDPSARIRSATIRGPVIIGPDAEISDAYIGPYSSIGRGVVIENSEVEHSIILPGASIRHLGGRLEASIVGMDARVFRDFRLPRAFRLNVGDNAEVALT